MGSTYLLTLLTDDFPKNISGGGAAGLMGNVFVIFNIYLYMRPYLLHHGDPDLVAPSARIFISDEEIRIVARCQCLGNNLSARITAKLRNPFE